MEDVGDRVRIKIVGKDAKGWPFGFLDSKIVVLVGSYAAVGDEIQVRIAKINRASVVVTR